MNLGIERRRAFCDLSVLEGLYGLRREERYDGAAFVSEDRHLKQSVEILYSMRALMGSQCSVFRSSLALLRLSCLSTSLAALF